MGKDLEVGMNECEVTRYILELQVNEKIEP